MIRGWKYLKTELPTSTVDPDGAVAAVQRARVALLEEERKTGRSQEITGRLKDLQARNHFAELLTLAMTPPPKERRDDGA